MPRWTHRSGLTLVELIVAFSILLILSTMALPLAHVKIQREKERRLRGALSEMRKAIDRYKDMADAGRLGQVDPDTFGYPPTLDILVEGVPVRAGAGGSSLGGGLGDRAGQTAGMGGRGGRAGNSFGRGGLGRSGNSLGAGSRGSRTNDLMSRDLEDETEEKKIRFLRKIPIDPITGQADWGLRAVEDDPGGFSWGGDNVFDVYSKSMDLALDGTRYNKW